MNCFQLVKIVLDELYAAIPGGPTEKDQVIKEKLDYLVKQYADLPNGANIDYADPVVRFAYVFRYVTAHASFVTEIVSGSPRLQALFERPKVDMTCIGGGPGSELLGALKYITQQEKDTVLTCNLYDRESAWDDTWHDVEDKVEGMFNLHTHFLPLDVRSRKDWTKHTKFLQSDLFTMVYFVSEIYKERNRASDFFSHLFAKAKPGALFLYVDNNSPCFCDLYDRLVNEHGLERCASYNKSVVISGDEQKADLQEYFQTFGFPKVTGNIAYRLHRKKK